MSLGGILCGMYSIHTNMEVKNDSLEVENPFHLFQIMEFVDVEKPLANSQVLWKCHGECLSFSAKSEAVFYHQHNSPVKHHCLTSHLHYQASPARLPLSAHTCIVYISSWASPGHPPKKTEDLDHHFQDMYLSKWKMKKNKQQFLPYSHWFFIVRENQ